MPRISRITNITIEVARIHADCLCAMGRNQQHYYGGADLYDVGDTIKRLLTEIDQLGGPLCRKCKRNKARYTSGCCGLCDMALPKNVRGVRFE